ncbi:C40 family peptidase [Alicyclobacillus sp.]|uniref:C40 family peptidase n=1 Tax=Alicyclobacillus sp. TaxID=61169 RepID=UPI0025C08D89|nr:C40 family peptidase [Alicyclobacillus sp.]MCL6515491.1 C40 family peptidase [Alicyclobacillus sp.]
MNTLQKRMTAGILGLGLLILLAGAIWLKPRLWPTRASSDPGADVSIQLVSSTSLTALAQNPLQVEHQDQVCAAVQQMLQSPPDAHMDASAFVQAVYAQAGIQLPRTIAEQANAGTLIPEAQELERGDLVFFDLDGTHRANFDGVYLGDQKFAALTTHGRMVISLEDPYWSDKYLYGRRVISP